VSPKRAPRRGASAPLEEYRAKRDFDRTAEPAGEAVAPQEATSTPRQHFVVQRHRARRLHYDLRLEVDGVLVSWAVPKGPTLDPSARVLAVHVEDHPIEYADFEGIIPAGDYGGGDVIVWDRGDWAPVHTDDPAAAIAAGELHFDLFGEKLAGRFVIIRRDRDQGRREQWLLLHKRDEHAVDGWDPEDHLQSVKSGRTNDEVAEAPATLWRSDAPAAEAEVSIGASGATSAPPPSVDELLALDELGRRGTWELQGRALSLTNLDKVLFPGGDGEGDLTKRDLIRYCAVTGPVMLPYLIGRALNLHRFPDGVTKPGFWQKAIPSHAPSWLGRWKNERADPGETVWYALADSTPALAWLANYGAVELHPWTSPTDRPDEPSWALVDIDPGTSTTFEEVLVLARLHRTALDHLGVVGGAKVSGRRGIQIFIPVSPGYRFDDTRQWVEELSRAIGTTVPELVSWRWQKDERKGKARLDFTQNAVNKTLVAPYSPRAARGATVSVPIRWEELDDPDLRPDRWTIRTMADRLASAGDPFQALLGVEQRLPALS
jgi:bifunctional non-homologous end joining protein LigD